MLKQVVAATVLLLASPIAQAHDWERHDRHEWRQDERNERWEDRRHHGNGLAIGLGIAGALVAYGALHEHSYAPPPPAPDYLRAVPGSAVQYPGYLQYEAVDQFQRIHICREFYSGGRECY